MKIHITLICALLIMIMIVICMFLCNNINNHPNTTYTDSNNPKYKLCVMAIFRNESPYMEEWLQHHIEQGVDHFYLYSNDPNMHNYTFLKNYTDYYTLIPWVNGVCKPGENMQQCAYTHCVKSYSQECEFLMMLDLDEFIISINPGEKVIDFINELEPKNTKAIKVGSFFFGTNGHILTPSGDVRNNYTQHGKICLNFKTIANTSFINKNQKIHSVHDFPYTDKYGKIYNNFFDIKSKETRICTDDNLRMYEIPLVINHYYTKSCEEYLKRSNMWSKNHMQCKHRHDDITGDDMIKYRKYFRKCNTIKKNNDDTYCKTNNKLIKKTIKNIESNMLYNKGIATGYEYLNDMRTTNV